MKIFIIFTIFFVALVSIGGIVSKQKHKNYIKSVVVACEDRASKEDCEKMDRFSVEIIESVR